MFDIDNRGDFWVVFLDLQEREKKEMKKVIHWQKVGHTLEEAIKRSPNPETTYLVKNHLLIWSCEFIVVSWRQVSSPRIKDLDQLSPVFDLVQGVVSDALRKTLQNVMQQFWFVKGHFLDFQVFFGRLAFNHVCGKCVGTSDKSKNSRFGSDLVSKNF
jgi:hypothetical protein